MADLIDGKAFAARLRSDIAEKVAVLKAEHDVTPGLAVVLVGDNPASQVYVRSKKKMTIEVGMASFEHRLAASTSQDELLSLIGRLNQDTEIHGILVQLPLPDHIDEQAVINAINPAKDVDGFHVVNTGKLVTNQPDTLVSCTPLGCLMLLQSFVGESFKGNHAVVLGRSNIVGKPMAQLLLNHDATVTVCHSGTVDIPALTRQADIVVAAVGKPEWVQADWVKDGAVVIDVGINRIEHADGTTKLVGDVDFEAVSKKASAITPVPGGVGPMTIACLLRNTLQATCALHHVPFPLADGSRR